MARLTWLTGFVLVALVSTLSLVACGGHRDAPLTSTATSYRLCELDLHCPGGMYCSAGVCDFDCRGDGDCASGQSCDLRGRCNAAGATAAPPVYAGHLVAPPSALALSVESPSAQLTLQNDGVEAIGRFHVISDDPNVTASPSSGTLGSGESLQLQVQVARGFTGTGATIHILTTGGRADVGVTYGSTLSGRLVGFVDVQTPYELGQAPFAIELGGSPDAMTGAVDQTASLLWPFNAAVAASDDGTNFNATFAFTAEVGQPGNPLLDVPVRRSIVLSGSHGGDPTAVTGTYTETIDGLPGGSVTTAGAFQLQQSGPATGVTAAASPTLRPASPGPLPAPCSCTDSACPGDPVGNAGWFFSAGFAFEAWSAADSYQGANSCLLGSGILGACTDASDIQCALGGFAAAAAEDGEVDVWRAQATYALLAGKSTLASVLQPVGAAFGSTLSIGAEIETLATAVSSLGAGLHTAAGGGGLLTAASLSAARNPGAMAQFNQPSTRDVAQLDDVQRFGGVVAARLFAAAEQLDRQQRNGVPGATITAAAQQVASGALLDLGAIGALLGPATEPVSGLTAAFAPLAGTFEKVVKDFNAVGYPSTYVPFVYDPSDASEDLFQQVRDLATTYQSTAMADETALIAENSNAQNAVTALDQQIEAASQAAGNQITALCGTLADPPPSTAGCGQAGQIGEDFDAMGAAAAGLQAAKDRHSAAVLKLGTLNQQAQQELQDQSDELSEQISANNTIELLDVAKAQQQEVSQTFQCVMGALNMVSGGVSESAGGTSVGIGGGGVGAAVSSCLPILGSLAVSPVTQAQQAAEAQADEQITLWLGSQQVTDNSMILQIQDAQADLTAAGEDVVQQTELFDAASQKWSDDQAQLQRAVDDFGQSNAEGAQAAADDPSFKLLQDADAIQWAADMRLARQWCFIAERALAYTLDATFPEQCLLDESAAQIAGTLATLTSEHDSDELQYGWDQERQDLISLQQDVFHITGPQTDPITGQTLTPGQQFQALLALPTHRDAAGNVQLEFATSIAASNGIFATDVGTDVIDTVAANLVGSELAGRTAYLTVTQSGSSDVRSYVDGSLTPYQLDPKTAQVPAGVNTTFPDPTITASTDLFGRSVDDSGWTLTIDQQDDPRNLGVTVSDIEDIQLWVDHRARTIQGTP